MIIYPFTFLVNIEPESTLNFVDFAFLANNNLENSFHDKILIFKNWNNLIKT
jgi:hypothetical protein